MKTIMVTGSCGYIGSNLCMMLIKKGYNIIQIDKKIHSDILSTDLNRYNPDFIVHLAAISSISECEKYQIQAIHDNVLTCNRISQFAREKSIPVFFASSQAVKNPMGSTYTMTKLIGEETFKKYNNCVIMRFANVFGGINFIDDKTSVVARWLREVQKGHKLTINGNGKQTRDFIHVDYICQVIIGYMESLASYYTTFDIGTGEEISLNKLASYFSEYEKLTGKDIFRFDPDSDTVGVMGNVADTETLNDIINDNLIVVEEPITVEQYIKEFLKKFL